ncbi:head GIN domain-containing protein [Chloroflexota bacterium]
MKKTIIIIPLLAAFLTVGLLVGCGGPPRTQTYSFTDFTRVEVGYAFQVEVTQSDSYSIRITAPENLLSSIDVSKEGETLKIGLTQFISMIGTRKVEITMPDLRAINLSGATKGTINGFISSHDFNLVLSGASRLDGDLTVGDIDFDISGASTVELDGSAQDITVDVSGASHVKLANFSARNAAATLSGASNGTVNLSGELDANLSGASRLSYIGNPTMGAVIITGASTLSIK